MVFCSQPAQLVCHDLIDIKSVGQVDDEGLVKKGSASGKPKLP